METEEALRNLVEQTFENDDANEAVIVSSPSRMTIGVSIRKR